MSTEFETIVDSGSAFRLGDWLVEPSLNRVSNGGVTVQLELKAMDVLLCLAGRAGELVDKRELLDAVWQTEFVSDNTLTRRIAELREALGDDARDPRYIETIPKRGYRLIGEVGAWDGEEPSTYPTGLPRPSPDDGSPYPGLSPFTEDDADNFFGRESEIGALWRRISGRRLLAVVGPSGAGKSSLLRAGVIARAPPGWRAVHCQPGEEPFLAVARALAPDLAGDAEETRQLLAFHDPDVALAVTARWRGRFDEALLVVDQFEELFTLNPEPVRERFVTLLRRLVDAAGIHLVLALRDDFLLECQRYRELAPIFAELTPVGPPPGPELRRALTEPAARQLHGFESELLVDEMVGEVEEERGALPLLAFAVSRLWELRDRERRLLTREAFERIGGVAGALAQHAEASLEAIGSKRLPVVRELFRNLVTAQGTRAVREVGDLLSVFDEDARDAARSVLNALVDARLLTSFEDEAGDEDGPASRHRVEIVHESLLRAWPRLVRWQTQDADAAQLRDQLRQAAQLWQARDRPDDLLWSGASYREYAVWRERYPGGLSTTEEAFAEAMTRHAQRRRRRRRIVTAVVLLATMAAAAVVTAMWWRSARHARRAEANALFRFGQSIVDKYPHGALGAALGSLELVDDVEVRKFAVQALQRGPKGRLVVMGPAEFVSVEFSPDGHWLAAANVDGRVRLLHESGGQPKSAWEAHRGAAIARFSPDSESLVSVGIADGMIRRWSVPDAELLDSAEAPVELVADSFDPAELGVLRRLLRVVGAPAGAPPGRSGWTVDPRPLEIYQRLRDEGRATSAALDPRGDRLAIIRGRELLLVSLDDVAPTPRLVGRGDEVLKVVDFHPAGDRVVALDVTGRAMMWQIGTDSAAPIREWRGWRESAFWNLAFDPTGSLFVAPDESGNTIFWGVDDPPDAEPMRTITAMSRQVDFDLHPSGRWFVLTGTNRLGVYPFDRDRYARVLRGHSANVVELRFGPDGRWLVSASLDGTVRLWGLDTSAGQRSRVVAVLERVVGEHLRLEVAPDGSYVAVTTTDGPLRIVPLDDSPSTALRGLEGGPTALAVSLDSRTVAAAGGGVLTGDRASIRVWDVGSAHSRLVERDLPGPVWSLRFTGDGRLLASDGEGVLRRYGREGTNYEVVVDDVRRFDATATGDLVVSLADYEPVRGARAVVLDLTASTTTDLSSHGNQLRAVALHAGKGLVVSGGGDRIVRVGDSSGHEPHLLFGHEGMIHTVAISPDGRWVASGSRDATVRLWRVPQGTPVQSLPLRQFLDEMRQNCHYVYRRDPNEAGGFSSSARPFAGWKDFPEF